MSQGPDLEALAVRSALIDVVVAYAMALDARDWDAFRALFEGQIEIDYSALGSIHATMPAQVWVDRCKVLGGFDATQHKVSNFVISLGGSIAQVTSYVDAAHFIHVDGRDLSGFCRGTYVHQMRRGAQGWKISRCKLIVVGFPGGRAAFDEAFDAARAVHAARSR